MELAADLGDRPAMLYMAKAFESGTGVGTERYGPAPACTVVWYSCRFILVPFRTRAVLVTLRIC